MTSSGRWRIGRMLVGDGSVVHGSRHIGSGTVDGTVLCSPYSPGAPLRDYIGSSAGTPLPLFRSARHLVGGRIAVGRSPLFPRHPLLPSIPPPFRRHHALPQDGAPGWGDRGGGDRRGRARPCGCQLRVQRPRRRQGGRVRGGAARGAGAGPHFPRACPWQRDGTPAAGRVWCFPRRRRCGGHPPGRRRGPHLWGWRGR